MIRIYCIGIIILITAIVANIIAQKLNIMTWYGFIEFLTKTDDKDVALRIIDITWLFVLYPLVLGFGYLLGDKLYQMLF